MTETIKNYKCTGCGKVYENVYKASICEHSHKKSNCAHRNHELDNVVISMHCTKCGELRTIAADKEMRELISNELEKRKNAV